MSRFGVEGFTDEELEYYSRQMVLPQIGLEGQRRLKGKRACVVGLGGLGSIISTQLASMGVGHLRIVDRDIVEISNLQRQHLYGVDVLGLPKVEAAAHRLRRLNPFIEVEPLPLSLNPRNVDRILEGVDVVLDGLDRMAPRYVLNRACVRMGIPYVYGAAITNVGNITTVIPGETACLECFQGGLDDASLPTCAVVGVNPSIVNIIASIEVSEAIRVLLGRRPSLANALLFCDLESLTFERISLKRAERCPACGTTAAQTPLPFEEVEEICGREGRSVFVVNPEDELQLDMGRVEKKLASMGLDIIRRGELGLTFSDTHGFRGSLLKSGVSILEGVKDREEALKIFHRILES
jgi:molybdopterin/thiamine biosynthesis adenylyltransferase